MDGWVGNLVVKKGVFIRRFFSLASSQLESAENSERTKVQNSSEYIMRVPSSERYGRRYGHPSSILFYGQFQEWRIQIAVVKREAILESVLRYCKNLV